MIINSTFLHTRVSESSHEHHTIVTHSETTKASVLARTKENNTLICVLFGAVMFCDACDSFRVLRC